MGDLILSTPLWGPVERGQIVVYRARGAAFVKRVVGVPGDTIGMRDGQLSVGGRVRTEAYAQRDTADPVYAEFSWQQAYLPAGADPTVYQPSLQNWGPLVIPADRYFVLGDNRNNSLDSRYTGFVPRDEIIARPTVVYFSRDRESGVIRWNRVGVDAR